MKHEVRLHNKWKVVVTNTKTGATREAVGENIILNQFWTKYLSAANATCLSYIHVGEGTDTPVATNTKLKTPFASYSSSGNVTDYSHFLSDGYITRQLSCRVEANTYVGKVIAEVGFAYSGATTGSLVTHALLKDMNGNAVTITIGADEVINIFGTVYFDLGYSHNSDTIFLLSGYNEYLVSAMLCFYTFSNINRITSTSASGYDSRKLKEPFSLTHNIIPNSSVAAYSTITFDTDNKKLTWAFADATTSANNLEGGIGSIVVGGAVRVVVPCTGFTQPVITKEVVGTGNGTNKDFQTDFGYIRNNSTAKAYVNDTEVNATFDYEIPHPSTLLRDIIDYDDASTLPLINVNTGSWNANSVIQFENPYYESCGFLKFLTYYSNIYTSDNNTDWALAVASSSTSAAIKDIPSAHQYKRYWKIVPYGSTLTGSFGATPNSSDYYVGSIPSNVHFESAPANSSTVAVTYQPNVLAKSSDRILKNMSFVFTFAEYTPT